MAAGSIKRQRVYSESLSIAGWQILSFARTTDASLFINIPAPNLDKTKTYTTSGAFNFIFFSHTGSVIDNLNSGSLKSIGIVGDQILLEYNIPSGLGIWAYGMIFNTTPIVIVQA